MPPHTPLPEPRAPGAEAPAAPWQSLQDGFAAFAREFVVMDDDVETSYHALMADLADVIASDPDSESRQWAIETACRVAGQAHMDYGETRYGPIREPGHVHVEQPSARTLAEILLQAAATAVMLGDEDFLCVAQAALGFGRSVEQRDLMAGLLSPLVWHRCAPAMMPACTFGGDDPVGRLRARANRRIVTRGTIPPQHLGGEATIPLDGITSTGVAGESVIELSAADWVAIEADLLDSRKRSDQRAGRALTAYLDADGSRAAMVDADYAFLRRQLAQPSRLGWLIRQRVALRAEA